MLLLQGLVTQWVADDPQPGLVRIEITDADGQVHRVEEKAAVVDADGGLTASTRYPAPVQIACRPRRQEQRPHDGRTLNVVDLTPWGVDDDTTLYPVERDSLTWTEPAIYSDLSIRARQATGLVTFRRWRHVVRLAVPELTTLENHLWDSITTVPDTFDTWHESHPLTQLGANEPWPQNVQDEIASCGINPGATREAVTALVGITHGGLFAGIDSASSLRKLETVGRFTAQRGVPLASSEGFVDSLWIDDNWGRPSEALAHRWHAIA